MSCVYWEPKSRMRICSAMRKGTQGSEIGKKFRENFQKIISQSEDEVVRLENFKIGRLKNWKITTPRCSLGIRW
jgi:hypothetical protein